MVEVADFVKPSSVTVAVTVAGTAVAPTHVANPLVWSFALLICTFTLSETVQVACAGAITAGTAQSPFNCS
jgi:hypothetical protein